MIPLHTFEGLVFGFLNMVVMPIQVLLSCHRMQHGQAAGARLPGPGRVARPGQARRCTARAHRSCRPRCSASPRRSTVAVARLGSVNPGTTQGTTALSPAAACPLQVDTLTTRPETALDQRHKDSGCALMSLLEVFVSENRLHAVVMQWCHGIIAGRNYCSGAYYYFQGRL